MRQDSSDPAPLLYHAKLAGLAQRYLVEPLLLLCIANLYHVLLGLSLKEKKGDILDLAEFAEIDESACGVPELAHLVVRYLAANIEEFAREPRLREILGDLGMQLLIGIRQRYGGGRYS